jgi:glycerophosphoryl diester phosphodiesterase
MKIIYITLSILAALLLGLAIGARPAPEHPYYANLVKPAVIAHQGGDDLFPGNTMYAFEQAVALGVDVLEMDLHITKDGALVLIHDETVDRTTDGSGIVEEMTLAEIKTFDAGYDWTRDDGQTYPYRGMGITIPTLDEVFTAFPNYHYTIEIKRPGMPMVEPFCAKIREYGMENKVLVASFFDDVLQAFRQECPEIATSSARQETTIFVIASKAWLGFFISPHYHSLQVPTENSGILIMTEQFVRAAHARNLRVEPWTINDTETMRRYIDWGVDGIITDRPDLMLELLGR